MLVSFVERLGPEAYSDTVDWVDTNIHTMECKNDTYSCSNDIHPSTELHLRPTIDSSILSPGMLLQNRQLGTTLPITKFAAKSESVRGHSRPDRSVTGVTYIPRKLISSFPGSQLG